MKKIVYLDTFSGPRQDNPEELIVFASAYVKLTLMGVEHGTYIHSFATYMPASTSSEIIDREQDHQFALLALILTEYGFPEEEVKERMEQYRQKQARRLKEVSLAG